MAEGQSARIVSSVIQQAAGALVVAAIIGLVGLGSGLWTGFSSFRNDLDRFSDRIDYLEREHTEFKSCLTLKDGKHITQQITGISETLMGLGEKCQTSTTKLELLDAEIRFLKRRLQ